MAVKSHIAFAISTTILIVCLVACDMIANSIIPEECESLELYTNGTVAEYVASVDAIGVCDGHEGSGTFIIIIFPMIAFCISFWILIDRKS